MRQRVKHRVAATSLLVLWILVPLLALAHVALEEHTYCAEHQRLEEAGDVHRGANGAISDVALGSEDHHPPTVSGNSSESDTGGHERCALGDEFTRDAQCPGLLVRTLTATQFFAPVAPPAASPALRTIALLRIAPKSSPPQLTA